jgi:hypothetical protein
MTYPDVRAALGRERRNTLLAEAEAAGPAGAAVPAAGGMGSPGDGAA